jgi:putative oxidoreductase
MTDREHSPLYGSELQARTGKTIDWQRWVIVYARIAVGAAFLSAVASRVGLRGGGFHARFANFVSRTAEVNSFMPAGTIPFLAWAATGAEITLGVLLIVGAWPRWVAWASAVLLAMFGTAMAISFGIKEPLDYSVFSASAAAALLGVVQGRSRAGRSG